MEMNLSVKGTTTRLILQVGFKLTLTIEWYRIFISNLNYQPNMTYKSIKMNLIVKGTTM